MSDKNNDPKDTNDPKGFYSILGIAKDSSQIEIRKAYKKAALLYHPDKNVDNRDEATQKFKQISEAYAILGDEEKRELYDRGNEDESFYSQEEGRCTCPNCGRPRDFDPFDFVEFFFGLKEHIQNLVNSDEYDSDEYEEDYSSEDSRYYNDNIHRPDKPKKPQCIYVNGKVKVTWIDNSKADCFKLYMKTNKKNSVPVWINENDLDSGDNFFYVEGLTPGTYFFCVAGVNDAGEGEQSMWTEINVPSQQKSKEKKKKKGKKNKTLNFEKEMKTAVEEEDFEKVYELYPQMSRYPSLNKNLAMKVEQIMKNRKKERELIDQVNKNKELLANLMKSKTLIELRKVVNSIENNSKMKVHFEDVLPKAKKVIEQIELENLQKEKEKEMEKLKEKEERERIVREQQQKKREEKERNRRKAEEHLRERERLEREQQKKEKEKEKQSSSKEKPQNPPNQQHSPNKQSVPSQPSVSNNPRPTKEREGREKKSTTNHPTQQPNHQKQNQSNQPKETTPKSKSNLPKESNPPKDPLYNRLVNPIGTNGIPNGTTNITNSDLTNGSHPINGSNGLINGINGINGINHTNGSNAFQGINGINHVRTGPNTHMNGQFPPNNVPFLFNPNPTNTNGGIWSYEPNNPAPNNGIKNFNMPIPNLNPINVPLNNNFFSNPPLNNSKFNQFLFNDPSPTNEIPNMNLPSPFFFTQPNFPLPNFPSNSPLFPPTNNGFNPIPTNLPPFYPNQVYYPNTPLFVEKNNPFSLNPTNKPFDKNPSNL